jgi:hypothetical protein
MKAEDLQITDHCGAILDAEATGDCENGSASERKESSRVES